MPDTKDLIREKLDIAEFIKQYVNLIPAGKNFKGPCPFHKEKTPSFMVNVDRQIWHCFGCGAGGDIFGFLMKFENLEFIEALKVLAQRAGVDLKVFGSTDEKNYNILYEINELAKDFFKNNLFSNNTAAEAARAYLKERGLKKETVLDFEIGFQPNASDGLSKFLLAKGFKLPDIEKAGLVFKTERGTYWDRFRDRIMFPISNHFGKVVGFTGRIMPGSPDAETSGKYVNSPETPIFNKSKILYGLHKAKQDIRAKNMAVLVEGQMDLVMMYQDGIRNVVASSGTAFTRDQLQVLRKLTDSITIFYDGDEAGKVATERANDIAQAEDFSVKVFNLAISKNEKIKKLKDAADVIKEFPGILESELSNNSLPFISFYIKNIFKNYRLEEKDIFKLKSGLKKVLEKIKILRSSVEQNFWIAELSDFLKIPEKTLSEDLKNIKIGLKHDNFKVPDNLIIEKRKFSKIDLMRQGILATAINHEAFFEDIDMYKESFDKTYLEIVSILKNVDIKNFSEESVRLADYIRLLAGEDFYLNVSRESFSKMLNDLKYENLRLKLEEMKLEIKDVEKKSNQDILSATLKKIDDLNKEMYNLRTKLSKP